jgi:hypothetical protein
LKLTILSIVTPDLSDMISLIRIYNLNSPTVPRQTANETRTELGAISLVGKHKSLLYQRNKKIHSMTTNH